MTLHRHSQLSSMLEPRNVSLKKIKVHFSFDKERKGVKTVFRSIKKGLEKNVHTANTSSCKGLSMLCSHWQHWE